MSIAYLPFIVALLIALGVGALVGWLASRPGHARLQTERSRLHLELEKDRAVHAERLKAYGEAEGKLREAFQALSADALKTNNEAFLSLAETRLREARTQATGDIDARKKAIEDLLAPMARTLDQVDREIKDSERRRDRKRLAADAADRLARYRRAGTARRNAGASPTRSSGRAFVAAGASCS